MSSSPASTNKALSPFAPSYIPYKFLRHSTQHPPPPPTLFPLPHPGFSPIFYFPDGFIHANFSFFHLETIQRVSAKQSPGSPSPPARPNRFRRGRTRGGFRNDEGSSPVYVGSGEMALTVATTGGRSPRVVHSFRKDVEYGCRAKTVVPVSEGGGETTVMIRNIPNKYTRDLLIQFLDDHCLQVNQMGDEGFVSAYDFIYLPLDLRKKFNLGYAFVNFTDPRAAWRFSKVANGKKWKLFYSKKISEIASARLQGKERLVVHFENTLFACESEDFLPVTFTPARDGTNAGSVVQSTVGEILTPGPDPGS